MIDKRQKRAWTCMFPHVWWYSMVFFTQILVNASLRQSALSLTITSKCYIHTNFPTGWSLSRCRWWIHWRAQPQAPQDELSPTPGRIVLKIRLNKITFAIVWFWGIVFSNWGGQAELRKESKVLSPSAILHLIIKAYFSDWEPVPIEVCYVTLTVCLLWRLFLRF